MHELKRSIGFTMLTLYGLGTILGAGIYVLVGKVAITAGVYAPISFLVAAVLAVLSGYSYTVLSARYPKSAGEAVYIQAAFGIKHLSSLVGWMVILTGVVSAATITNGFVGYLQVFMDIPDFWAVTILLSAMTVLAIWGVSESVMVTAITTIMGIVGLIIILVFSAPAFLTLPERLPELTPPLNDSGIWFGILLGAFLAFYAFIGFEDMVNMAEEVKDPKVTLPKAIITAIIVSSLFYYAIALAAVLQLPLETLMASKAPMADIMKQHSEQAAWFISLISLAAVVNGALVQIIMGSRVLYGMGKQGMAPLWLSTLHPARKTPYIATLILGLVVWLLATHFDLTTLAKITSFIILVVFFLVNVSLIKLLKTPSDANATHVKMWVPYLGATMCLGFIGVQLFQLISGAAVATH
ncbi:MAG: APA family basic amino acid/polyamine antiporter [Oceanicoccus sp.]|jgi:APA family basic amino acid/polyamine antiporter